MHIDSAEPNLLRSENRDEGDRERDSGNTTQSELGAGSEFPVADQLRHDALPRRPPKERILSSRVRRAIAVGMLVLLVMVSAVGFYSRESRTFHMATTGAPEISHPPR
jgi:hypothetical protein